MTCPPRGFPSTTLHIPLDLEALRETLRESLSGLQPRTGDIEFISAVTGAGLDTSILDGEYWFANLRQPVLFEQSCPMVVRTRLSHVHRVQPAPCADRRHPGIVGGIRRRPQRDWDA